MTKWLLSKSLWKNNSYLGRRISTIVYIPSLASILLFHSKYMGSTRPIMGKEVLEMPWNTLKMYASPEELHLTGKRQVNPTNRCEKMHNKLLSVTNPTISSLKKFGINPSSCLPEYVLNINFQHPTALISLIVQYFTYNVHICCCVLFCDGYIFVIIGCMLLVTIFSPTASPLLI